MRAKEPPAKFPGAGFRGRPRSPGAVAHGDAGEVERGAGGSGSFVNGGGWPLSDVGVREREPVEFDEGTVSLGTERGGCGVGGTGPLGGTRILVEGGCGALGVGVAADFAES